MKIAGNQAESAWPKVVRFIRREHAAARCDDLVHSHPDARARARMSAAFPPTGAEALANIREAIALCLENREREGWSLPPGYEVVNVDVNVAA